MTELINPYWLAVIRLAYGLVFLAAMLVGLWLLRSALTTVLAMLKQIQSDRLDRDATMASLRATAEALSNKADEVAAMATLRGDTARDTIMTSLQAIDRKVDDNTMKTVEAAHASAEAAHAANDANAKIAKTNEHVAKLIEGQKT